MSNILLNPGPTNTSFMTKLMQWLSSDRCHRTKEFSDELKKLQKSILRRFDPTLDKEIAIMGGSGTTALDAMISSLLPPEVVVINAGSYGQRAEDICQTYKIDHKVVHSETIDDLQNDPDVNFVYFVENETSTGEKYEIERMCKIYPNARFFIDATSAFGSSDYSSVSTRIAGISFCSNKCLQSTPGLGIIIWDKNLHIYRRSFYGNLSKYGVDKMPFTVPVQSVGALNHAMRNNNNKVLFDTRKDKIIKDLQKINIKCLSKNPCNSVIAFEHPTKSYQQLQNFLRDKGIVIYSGVEGMENSFRIATMSKKFDRKYKKILGALHDSCIH